MILIRFQVISKIQGFGHRSRLGSIYGPCSESASIIREERAQANNRGDMPVQHLVNLMHHMVLQAQDGTYYAQSEVSIVPVLEGLTKPGGPWTLDSHSTASLYQMHACYYQRKTEAFQCGRAGLIDMWAYHACMVP